MRVKTEWDGKRQDFFNIIMSIRKGKEALPTQNVSIWRSGNKSQQSTTFHGCFGTVETNPADSTCKANSLCSFYVKWSSVMFAQKRPSERNLYALSTFQTRLRLWEQKLNQSFEYLYFYLKHGSCHLGWMVMLAVTEASWLPIASVLTALPFESKALTAPLFLLLFFLAAHKCPGPGLARESTATLTSSWLRSMNSVSLTY